MKLRSTVMNGTDVSLAMSMAALEAKIKGMWNAVVVDPPLAVITSSSMEVNRALDDLRERHKDQQFDMPIAILVPATWEINRETYSAFGLQREGVVLNKDDDNRTASLFKLLPVSIGFGFRFACINVEEAHQFAALWLKQNGMARMNFRSRKGGALIPVQIKFDPNVPVEEAQFGGEEKGDLIQINSTLIMNTYVGTEETVNLINKISTEYRSRPLLDPSQYTVEDSVVTYLGDEQGE